jgi:hypothetical protein
MKCRFLFMVPLVSAVVAVGSVLFAVEAVGQGNTLSANAEGTPVMKVVSSADEITLNPVSPPYQDIDGASLSVKVPSTWTSGLLLIHFSTTADCTSGVCQIQLLVDGQLANPNNTPNFALPIIKPNPNQQDSIWPLSLDGWARAAPGTHTIQVQCYTGTGITLYGWMLTVERIKSTS